MLNSQFVGDRVNQSPMAEHRQYKERQSIDQHKENLSTNPRNSGSYGVKEVTHSRRNEMESYYLEKNAQRKWSQSDYQQDPFDKGEVSQNTAYTLEKRRLVNWEDRDTVRSVRHQQTTQEERTLAWVRKHWPEDEIDYIDSQKERRATRTTQEYTNSDLQGAMQNLELRPKPYCQNANGFVSKHSSGYKFE